jgi:hypothetical protein
MWGNVLCLLLLSAPAREAVAPIRRTLRFFLDCLMTVGDCMLLTRPDRWEDLEFPDAYPEAIGRGGPITQIPASAPHPV